jgi:hypothetical protein
MTTAAGTSYLTLIPTCLTSVILADEASQPFQRSLSKSHFVASAVLKQLSFHEWALEQDTETTSVITSTPVWELARERASRERSLPALVAAGLMG